MGVINPYDGIARQNANTHDLLKQILTQLKNWNKDGPTESVDSDESLFTIYKKGYMVWWKKIPEAATYILTLYVGKHKIGRQEIDVIEIERNKAYHTFTDLVGADMYTVRLEAEDRDGNVIDSVEINL